MISLDTSILVAGFTPDAMSNDAEAFLRSNSGFLITDWAAAEFSAAIRLKVRQGVLIPSRLEAIEHEFEHVRTGLGVAGSVLAQDIRAAREIVRRQSVLRAPDALHVAMAIRLQVGLATFDRQQALAAEREGLQVTVPLPTP